MPKELQEDVGKVREAMYEQNGKTYKEIENLKRNSGTDKYDNENEKLTRKIQSKFGQIEERIDEGKAAEVVGSEEQKKKTLERSEL